MPLSPSSVLSPAGRPARSFVQTDRQMVSRVNQLIRQPGSEEKQQRDALKLNSLIAS